MDQGNPPPASRRIKRATAGWLAISTDPGVQRRAIVIALFVGTILTAINHGGAIASGHFEISMLWQVVLTFAVPYLVTCASSVAATLTSRRGSGQQFALLEREVEAINKFPDQNPNPVMRMTAGGQLLYANTSSAPILAALGAKVGDRLPEPISSDLREAATAGRGRTIEMRSGVQTFVLLPIDVPELGFVNLYGTDVTASKVIDKFPDRNPNPVLRMTPEGTLGYANAASAPITEALSIGLEDPFPPALQRWIVEAADRGGGETTEIQGDGRTYSLKPVRIEEFGFINLYGTDITALKALDKFPDQNPNPVLRVSPDGRLTYANPASHLIKKAIGVEVGDPLPRRFRRRMTAYMTGDGQSMLEIESDGRVFEVLVVSVYEFGFINLYGTDVTAARQFAEANRENERLLLNILPAPIADRLRKGEMLIADGFEAMTVLFADLVEFTRISSQLTASEVVALLNLIFRMFDGLVDKYGLEKIKTIGDAYMVVGGLEEERSDNVERVASLALDMLDGLRLFGTTSHEPLELRIGLHTGPAVAGVIGFKKFIYDVWGDTVNTASRMESTGIPGRIQVTDATYERLKDTFTFERRGLVDVKGKGPVMTYFLTGRIESAAATRRGTDGSVAEPEPV
ncbi:MAG TPA: nitrate/nitrite transporter NrtS [Candidatus Limnocylindrales bacterium]|jgi:class 3 adenylate cyclase